MAYRKFIDTWIKSSTIAGLTEISFQYKNIFVVPSRSGMIFLFLILIQLIAAINYRNNIIYGYTFLHFSFFLITPYTTYRAIRQLLIHCKAQRLCSAGKQLPLKINFASLKKYIGTSFIFKVTDNKHINDSSDEGQASLQLAPANRGVYTMPTIEVTCGYPCGLFWAKSYFIPNVTVYIYPQPKGKTLAEHFSLKNEDTLDELYLLKEYHDGESMSRVDWKAYGRTKKLYSKEFKGPVNDSHYLFFDVDAINGGIEERLSQLSLWVIEAEKQQLPYTLKLHNWEASGNGKTHLEKCQIALTKYE